MSRSSRSNKMAGVLATISLVAVVATWLLVSGAGSRADLGAGATAHLRPTGEAQLVSVDPLPQMDGQMCEWEQASATTSLSAALAAADTDAPKDLDRKPVRSIRDPNPSFSAIAVEPKTNMLVVTDENLFRVLEYNRQDNTPKSAKLTEPKRIIGGTMTKAEMMCGVYIDPVTLDTYIVNNDTQDWLSIFSKNARGNVAPDRVLAVPHGTFGIAVDRSEERRVGKECRL